MKKIILSGLIVVSALGLGSCSEDFTVAAPYKNITIVYGLVNMLDSAHYIRIEKAFLDENKSAFDMAKEPDSSFYKQLDVKIKEYANGTLISTTTLDKVDMNLEGYPKDTGIFFTSPNYAYKTKKTLSPSYKYRLVITNPETGVVDSSEIDIVDATSMQITNATLSDYTIKLSQTTPTDVQKYSIYYKVPATARYVEGVMRFHWVDKNTSSGEETDHYADYTFDSREVDNIKKLSAPTIQFYSFLRDAMLTAPANVERYMDSTDLYLYAAGSDLYNYIVTAQVQAGGITADQLKPIFTNIQGPDVYGLFASRAYFVKENVPFDQATIDSFKMNAITAPLNIKGVSDH